MTWASYPLFSYISLAAMIGAALPLIYYRQSRRAALIAEGLIIVSGLSILLFTIFLWIDLNRPPLRTLGETRLWYAMFMPAIGFLVLKRWKYSWFAGYCLLMGAVFLLTNLLNPEIHDKTLMPALQSIWFIPHVVVYLVSYSLLGAATIAALCGLYAYSRCRNPDAAFVRLANNLVCIGFGFLTLGLIFGALWAKEAWGHYWTWDPKETWALITWLGYLIYIHVRRQNPQWHVTALLILALSFVLLLVCWFGINYLPAAHNSVHVYGV